MSTKDTNPKDAVGGSKPPLSGIPGPVLFEVGAALLEGALKYGRHNYRVAGVRASVYYDAALRHLIRWWEGENNDPDSGLSHITKAIASLVVLRDAQMNGMVTNDDRPPQSLTGWFEKISDKVKDLIARHPNPLPPFTSGPGGNFGPIGGLPLPPSREELSKQKKAPRSDDGNPPRTFF